MQNNLPLSSSRGNSTISMIIVLAVSLIVALILGVQMGSGDYYSASVWLIIALVALYVVRLHYFTWQMILLAAFLGFTYRPLGFEIRAEHISALLGITLFGLYLLSSSSFRPAEYLNNTGLTGFRIALFLWLAYGAAHFAWNHVDPYLPSQYSMKNALKTYVTAFGGTAVLFLFIARPNGFRISKNWPVTLIALLFCALVVNIAIRFYYLYLGISGDQSAELVKEVGPIYIPVINLLPNVIILRALGPLAVAFSLIFMTSSRWWPRQATSTKVIVVLTFALALLGSVLSAGRATVLIAGFYIFVICLLRRKGMLIGACIVAGVIFLAFVNVFSGYINRYAPHYVARSLQYFMIEKGSTQRYIESSTNWRKILAERTYDEWRSDTRILLFGRASYSFSERDLAVYEQRGHYEALIEISLRRGNSHRLIADVLIQYGIVGAVLFYLVLFMFLRYLIKLYRRQPKDSEYRNLAFILIVMLIVHVPMTFVATAWFTTVDIWLTLLLTIGYAGDLASKRSKAPQSIPVRMPTGEPSTSIAR